MPKLDNGISTVQTLPRVRLRSMHHYIRNLLKKFSPTKSIVRVLFVKKITYLLHVAESCLTG